MTTSARSAATGGTSSAADARIRSPQRSSIVTHRSWPQMTAGRNTELPKQWS